MMLYYYMVGNIVGKIILKGKIFIRIDNGGDHYSVQGWKMYNGKY